MLQSVGMTAGQGKKMLVLESIYYMAMALLVFVTVGYGVSYFAVNTVTQGSAALPINLALRLLLSASRYCCF